MKITKIDRGQIRILDAAIQMALGKVETDYGVKITIGGGNYSAESYNPKITVRVTDATGAVAQDPMFKHMLAIHGLDASIVSRDGYRLVGYNARAPKYPWNIVDRSGQGRRATQGWVNARFKVTSQPNITAPKINPPAAPAQPPARQYDSQF